MDEISLKEEEEFRKTYINDNKKKDKEIINNFYRIYKLPNEGIDLKNLSQSYLYPKKEKAELFFLNEIIMICKDNINPIKDKDDINSIKIQINKNLENYKNKINPISTQLNLTQTIYGSYDYSFELNNNKNGIKEFEFNKLKKPLLFIFLDKNLSENIINKIKEIKNYELEKVEGKKFEFELILIIKKNNL